VNTRTKITHTWQIWLAAVIFGVLLPLLGLQATAQAADASTVGVEQNGNGNGGGNDAQGIYGIATEIPAGLVGTWTISGTQYVATGTTEFDTLNGDFVAPVCVKVHLVDGSTTEARQIETQPSADCSPASNGGDGNGGDENDREIRGIVEVTPTTGGTPNLSTLIGVWTISGKPYTTTAQTEFKQEYGPLGVGACVKVHLKADGATVREMETARDVHCSGAEDHGEHHGQAHGELFAAIVSFPADPFVGDWVIGNITVTADITTEFKQANGAFAVGTLVKVEFIVNADSSFLATEIKTAVSPDGGDHHDDEGDHDNEGHHDYMDDAKAFGIINAVTSTVPSVWQIGGISYTVTISTELDAERGPFVVGQNVKVEYTVDADGNRTAKEIKSMPAGAGGSENGHSKLVGFVETAPPSGFVGEWRIGGVSFTADLTSTIEEEHGLLVEGAFVEVEYSITNNVRLISKLETCVPPGAGDDDHAGKVEQMDDNSMAAAAGANSTWRVGGRNFTVTPATTVSSGVTKNSLAVVNSYTAADGSQVATRINSVTLNSLLFLPTARK